MIPVISTTTSVLGYNQYESWQYQPYATNTPTSWACPNLPAGLSINTSTGLISGAATAAGVFICGLTATNSDGTSTPLLLTIGIAAVASSQALLTNSGIQLQIDVTTRTVTTLGAAGSTTTSTAAAAAGSAPQPPPPIFFARQNDSVLIWLQFVKNGVACDLAITALEIAVKELESASRIILGNTFLKFGTGTGAYYGLFCDLSTAAGLADILANYQDDAGTSFDALAEIEWTETNANHSTFGPASFVFTSSDFGIQIATDMAA